MSRKKKVTEDFKTQKRVRALNAVRARQRAKEGFDFKSHPQHELLVIPGDEVDLTTMADAEFNLVVTTTGLQFLTPLSREEFSQSGQGEIARFLRPADLRRLAALKVKQATPDPVFSVNSSEKENLTPLSPNKLTDSTRSSDATKDPEALLANNGLEEPKVSPKVGAPPQKYLYYNRQLKRYKDYPQRGEYEAEKWALLMFACERGILETYILANDHFDDTTVVAALNRALDYLDVEYRLDKHAKPDLDPTGQIITKIPLTEITGDTWVIWMRWLIKRSIDRAVAEGQILTPTASEISGCLARILESVDLATSRHNPKGYLVYLKEFLAQMGVTVHVESQRILP